MKLSGSTRADDLRYWKNADGETELVAFELKTPDGRPGTVGDFFSKQHAKLAEQVGGRTASLQSYGGHRVHHDLVIDLRNMKTTPEQAIEELRYMFEYNRNNPDPRDFAKNTNLTAIEGFYERVRFVVDDAGTPTVTAPFTTRP